MANRSIESELREFIIDEILGEDEGFKLELDDSLLNGLIDSFGLTSLIAFMEETYGISVDVGDVTKENFQSIRALEDFVRTRRGLLEDESDVSGSRKGTESTPSNLPERT